MDTDMTDVAYDIDLDIGTDGDAGTQAAAQQQPTTAPGANSDMPAAYFESLDTPTVRPWPEALNLQGVSNFDPNDPLYYAMEQIGAEPRVKQLRWVHDNSVNLEFYSASDAALALRALTHPDAGDATSLEAQTSRPARPYSKKPDIPLIIRESNSGDQKARGAATRSNYYRRNPDVRDIPPRDRGDRVREPRRRPPPRRDFLDYDDDMPVRDRRRRSDDDSMNDGSDYDRRRFRRNGNRDGRERGGRLKADVDSYRPGSRSPRESRFGRLRGRSASPGSGEEGDGRYGFAEDGGNTRHRYRSRSRSRIPRRRRDPSTERWAHDRAHYTDTGGRWARESTGDAFQMSNHHRRSDAFDETANAKKGSLLSRMTKDGQPLVPQVKRPSLASRITRDDDEAEPTYGRLKNDDTEPWTHDLYESAPKRDLASRITRDNDDINIRGRSTEGINIRGRAGFSIRGAAH